MGPSKIQGLSTKGLGSRPMALEAWAIRPTSDERAAPAAAIVRSPHVLQFCAMFGSGLPRGGRRNSHGFCAAVRPLPHSATWHAENCILAVIGFKSYRDRGQRCLQMLKYDQFLLLCLYSPNTGTQQNSSSSWPCTAYPSSGSFGATPSSCCLAGGNHFSFSSVLWAT